VLRAIPAGKTDYTIRGRLVELYELDEGEEWSAVLTLELRLEDGSGNRIFSIAPRARVKAERTGDFTGMAGAMSQALEKVTAEFVEKATQHGDH